MVRRRLGALGTACLLSLTSAPGAVASEWDAMRERQRAALRASAARLAEIESQERAGPLERDALADKITRDRIARARSSLDGGRPSEGKALYERQGQLFAAVQREWGTNGATRAKLRESRATLQRNLELVELNLGSATDALQTAAGRIPQSGVLRALAQIETTAREAGERLSARWQREHDARERARLQREREAGERERGVR